MKNILKPRPCKELAEEIRRVAFEKKWSTAQTLTYFGISAPTLSRWEVGLGGPNIDTYFRVMNKLVEVKGDVPAPQPAPKPRGPKPTNKKE